jgi:Acetyltransferase (GNAT) domain
VNGYLHPSYASSLTEFGQPYELPHSRGWILQRRIQGFADRDAMGVYPLFACEDWSNLQIDLDEIQHELISLALITDPFGDYNEAYLRLCFKDVVFPFKEHFVVDLKRPIGSVVSDQHHRNIKKALQRVCVERCSKPGEHLDEWVGLYTNLIRRYQITGIAAFSRDAFARQLDVPGIVAFRARNEGITVGMLLWYIQGNVGYYHLGAYSEFGYELRASFGLFSFAIEHFAAHGLRWLNLGAGAGVKGDSTDGLSRFKRGWSSGTRTVYFCGRIFNHVRYEEIVKATGLGITKYFPAYRRGEFR